MGFAANKANAITGPSWVLFAPITVTVPTRIADIVSQVADINGLYQPVTGWNLFGIAGDNQETGRNFEAGEIESDNAGILFRRVTSFTPSIKVHMAELSPQNLKVLYNTRRTVAVAAAVGKSAETQIPYGTVEDFDHYRIAIIGQRPKSARPVVEPVASGGRTRGAMLVNVIYDAQITADDVTAQFDAQKLVDFELDFTGGPVASLPFGEEYGVLMDESAGTIT